MKTSRTGTSYEDKQNGHFIWRQIYIFNHILIKSSHTEKCFRKKLYRKSKDTFHVQYLFFRKLWHLWENVEQYCRAGQYTNDSMVHTLCMLDTNGYKYTLRTRNTY
jgi:hypothetical protein